MAKKKTKAPPPNTTEVANPAPTVSPDVQTGLENIKQSCIVTGKQIGRAHV